MGTMTQLPQRRLHLPHPSPVCPGNNTLTLNHPDRDRLRREE
jgi:hypothetical protein